MIGRRGIGRLGSVWNAPAASPAPPKRVWRDWVLVAVIPPLAVLEGVLRPGIPSLVPAVIVTILAVPTLLWRRTRPLLMLIIALGATEVFRLVTASDLQLYTVVYLLLLVYSVFRWGSGRAAVVGLAIMLATTTVSTLLAVPFDAANVVGSLAIVLLTVTFGLLFRFRAEFRMRALERAKSDEREELARDLHDTVAHHVSAIAIQAQAGLATVDKNPDAATAALRIIEAEASRTLTEMRSMVRDLRRDDVAQLAPAATIADVRQLATPGRGGPEVDVQVSGDIQAVPAPVAAAVYRIAQESVTNAKRHARGATRIDVRVEVAEGRVRVAVHDDGASAAAGPVGYGITGMTERAALLGGTLTAGPGASGWTVTADLPTGARR
jgi:signal transduction histidine kinase